jgi:hypothetical protein
VNGGNWRHEKHTDFFGYTPLFFHIIPKCIQTLAIAYYDIFHILAVEGDIFLLKPFRKPWL